MDGSLRFRQAEHFLSRETVCFSHCKRLPKVFLSRSQRYVRVTLAIVSCHAICLRANRPQRRPLRRASASVEGALSDFFAFSPFLMYSPLWRLKAISLQIDLERTSKTLALCKRFSVRVPSHFLYRPELLPRFASP